MTSAKISQFRGPSILRILKTHGPLSFQGLRHFVSPPMKERRLHEVLERLVGRNLVTKRLEKVYRGIGIHYQVAQHPKHRRAVAQILKCLPEELKQPQYRSRDLLHAEKCALWSQTLSDIFPDATTIRDFDFFRHPLTKDVMTNSEHNGDMTPDIMLVFPKNQNGTSAKIAVEIERSQKDNARLHGRIEKYSKKSCVDGVICICSTDRLSVLIGGLYRNFYMKNVDRIAHYGKHFFMFLSSDEPTSAGAIALTNGCQQAIPLVSWVATLRAKELNFRRDSDFAEAAPSCCLAAL